MGFCSYCDEEGRTLFIEEVADLVERAFEEHYERTATEPDGFEYAMSREVGWDRDGEEAKWAILNAADVCEEIAEDIRCVLEDRHYDHGLVEVGEECAFSHESHYTEKDAGHGEFLVLWNDFERGLKTQSRFFSPSAKLILDQIFNGVAELRTTSRTGVVVTIGPGMPINALYRARVFAGEDDKLAESLKAPWKHLGTPPTEAACSGRMNARGIAVFYGARDARTALSEVRPPVGSKVALAIFNIMRPLRLLDLTALRSVSAGGSIFDPATIVQMQRCNFLEVLSHLMSRAVMPHEEASEYLPTQAVADYLANEARLDGIVFPSVQTGQESSNVVLFHHAARVEEVELPKGTKVDVQLEMRDSDGVQDDYRVLETMPPPPELEDESLATHWMFGLNHFFDHNLDTRAPTLSIDLETIHVHHVKAVTFEAPSHAVTRHQLKRASYSPHK
ncbi:RES domain-containing protein [Prosthecobacter algae]|uniref:RES domain-containing protein n=1 Tax=Prosthecobacter algae TaxID=1144682 RepID=A0ABP9P8N2_9BACT